MTVAFFRDATQTLGVRSAALLLLALTSCAKPVLTKDGSWVLQEKGARGATVVTANGVEFHDSEDVPSPVIQKDPMDPWRAPIGFILPKSGVFTKTSTPLTLATQGAVVVVRSSDTRVPSWGGEILVRVDVHALGTGAAPLRDPERVCVVIDGNDDATLALVQTTLGQLGEKDVVSVIDARGAKLLVPQVPATHRALALAATATRLAKDRPRALAASLTRGRKLLGKGGRLVVLSKEAKTSPDAATLAAFDAAMTDGVSVGAFDPAARRRRGARAQVRAALRTDHLRGRHAAVLGVPAPTHVLEATSGDTVWTLDGGDLSLGALHAGETRTEVLRITVPPWVPGTKFVLRIEAELEDFATGKSRNVAGQLGSTYDDDIERIAESRHGDVIAYASALATMHRLTAAFAGDAVDAQGGLLALAKLHSGSLTRLAKDFPDRGFAEDAAVLSALLSSAE